MLSKIRDSLTYANVTATLALFLVVSGGVAVAVTRLDPNSVRSKHLVDDQVRRVDVRDDTLRGGGLTGAQLIESSLGKVPNASKVDGVDSIDLMTRPPPDPGPLNLNMVWRAYEADVLDTEEYDFGRVHVATVGQTHAFYLCTNSAATIPYVAYVSGARSTGTVSSTSCSSLLDPGDGGDLRIIAGGSHIFGQHAASLSRFWSLLGFSTAGLRQEGRR
jgi:hypothetical protein